MATGTLLTRVTELERKMSSQGAEIRKLKGQIRGAAALIRELQDDLARNLGTGGRLI